MKTATTKTGKTTRTNLDAITSILDKHPRITYGKLCDLLLTRGWAKSDLPSLNLCKKAVNEKAERDELHFSREYTRLTCRITYALRTGDLKDEKTGERLVDLLALERNARELAKLLRAERLKR